MKTLTTGINTHVVLCISIYEMLHIKQVWGVCGRARSLGELQGHEEHLLFKKKDQDLPH